VGEKKTQQQPGIYYAYAAHWEEIVFSSKTSQKNDVRNGDFPKNQAKGHHPPLFSGPAFNQV